jgi:CRP/FNR family transcriptional regulator
MVAVAVLGPDMRRLMGRHPDICMRLVIALGRRLRETNERLARQSFQTVQSRVALALAELAQRAIAEGAPAADVPVLITQAAVAQLAGSSRESASRFLAVLERAGVITQRRAKIIVHDPASLEAYVY